MTDFLSHFNQTYYEQLQTPTGANPQRPRGDSLRVVFEHLQEKKGVRYNVLETGCMRPDHGHLNFGGDGCATLIFDDFVRQCGGEFISIDINPKAVEYAKANTQNAKVICADSVATIYGLITGLGDIDFFDLVYLDSFDIEQANPHPSQLHHLKELCAAMPLLKPGALVVVDDHDAFFTGGQIGKGNYVKSFMQDIGAEILYEGYQIVFLMP